MSEKSKEQGRVDADHAKPPPADLPTLAKNLRDAAENLPDHLRDEAVSAADKIHEHAISERPDAATINTHLTGLASIADLAPAVNALLEAISNIGM